MRNRLSAAAAAWSAALAACQNAGGQRVLGIEATAELRGVAYLDRDRSRRRDAEDTILQGVRVYLTPPGAIDTVARAVSDGAGLLKFERVPVGRYAVRVDSASGGDTVVVVVVDSATVTLGPADTTLVSVGLSYPLLTVAQVRSASTNRKVFIEGVALTGPNVFGDTTAHVLGATGALRLVRVLSGTFTAGDSVRVRGTVSNRDGQPVLRDVAVFPVGVGNLPAIDSITTAQAASAASGARDAGVVRAGGTLLDSMRVGPDLGLDVDDGSGVLRVLLDDDVAFDLGPFAVRGARVRATGVLVPSGTGMWWLKPRNTTELRIDVDVVPIAQARQQSPGERVFVDGVALNRPNVFGDSTMHMADTSGAIRVVQAVRSLDAGDSIRVAGYVGTRDGQVVITQPTIFVLGVGTPPFAPLISTGAAATASGGTMDAAFVRVLGTVQDTTSGSGGDFRATVDDGSGVVTIVLDGDVGFSRTGWAPMVTAEVRGLLVPEGTVWVVKPRAQADVARP